MSLLLSRLAKPALVRRRSSVSLLLSNGFSSSLLQSPPCSIIGAARCGYADRGKLVIATPASDDGVQLEKTIPLELVARCATVTIGASHGWIATLKDDGILRLQDDLNPAASDTDPKRIPLPPLVALPHCQTQIVTNVSMSSSSPEDEDCVVAAKFLGPQLSYCRPASRSSKPEWTNIRIQNECFYSSPVMFSKKHEMFRILGSGGHLMGSWDLCSDNPDPKFQKLRFRNLPKLTKTKRELLDSCCTSQHLVESRSTGETFLVKWYKKTADFSEGMARMGTRALMVFKLDDEGNAVYTRDIGDLCIFISKSEPFCVPASSFPGMDPNRVRLDDVDEIAIVLLDTSSICNGIGFCGAPYQIPPQKLDSMVSLAMYQ